MPPMQPFQGWLRKNLDIKRKEYVRVKGAIHTKGLFLRTGPAVAPGRSLGCRTGSSLARSPDHPIHLSRSGPRVALVYFWNIPGYSWMNQTGVQLHAWHALLRGVNP